MDNYEVHSGVIDTVINKGKPTLCSRQYILLNLEPDGSEAMVYVGNANKIGCDDLFQPKSLYHELREHLGEIPSVSLIVGALPWIAEKIAAPLWHIYGQWQADCINYLSENHDYEVVFSHFHNVDCYGHVYWERCAYREEFDNDPAEFLEVMEQAYVDTDDYIGQFVHLLYNKFES